MAHKRRKTVPLPLMVAELTASSWETVARRTWMMARGTCSPAEYQRMVAEKTAAACLTGFGLATGTHRGSVAALLDPWHSRATANAKRLRRKG